ATCPRKPGDLTHHVGQLAAPLRTACHRNDAEGAPIIAAALHRDERRDRIAADGRNVLVVLPPLEGDIGGALAGSGLRDQLGQAAVAVGPDDEVDLRDTLEQFRTEPLRHASYDAQHVTGAL